MNPQFMPGQPPLNNNPSSNQLPYPSSPFMPPPLNNGTNHNPQYPPQSMGNPPVSTAGIGQKMQALNIGQNANGPFLNGQPIPQGLGQKQQFAIGPQGNQMPPGQMSPGQMPPGQMPPGQMPLGQMPPGQMPPGQMPPGQMPPGQMPPGQMPPGQMPPGQMSQGQLPPGQMPPGQMPPGKMPLGSLPSQGQFTSGQLPPGQFPPGQLPPSQLPPGQFPPGRPMPAAQLPSTQQAPQQTMAGVPQHNNPPQGPPGAAQPTQGLPPMPRPPSNFSSQQQQQPISMAPPPTGLNQPSMQDGGPIAPPKSQTPVSMSQQMPVPGIQNNAGPMGFPPQGNNPNLGRPGIPSQPPQGQFPLSSTTQNRPNFPPMQAPQNQQGFLGQNAPPSQFSNNPQNNMINNTIPGFQNNNMTGPKPPGAPMGSMPHPGMPPLPGQQYQKPQMPISGVPPLARDQSYPPPAQQYPGYPNQQGGGFPAQPPQPNQHAGYPAQQPGYPGPPQGYPNQQQGQYGYQNQAPKRLNPDQMPSPIQVMTDDQNNNSGVFVTNQKGLVPPLVTTDFIVDDQGNASPRYIRSSMYSVPATPDMIKQTAVPFCVVVSPMAETVGAERPPPLLDMSQVTGSPEMGPVRCSRCKAYMCPAMKFVDGGRHFQCAFCKATTEVPMEYTQYLNNGQHYGHAIPEMSLGCYEIVATKEYCRNNVLPSPPAIIFVVDVSYNAIRSGLTSLVVGQLKSLLEKMPAPPRVGLITYGSTVHFYNINETLAQPQMMVVGDVQDVFVPLARGLLVDPGKAGHLLDALAEQIPAIFQETKETETILLPAVVAGLEALKAAECVGKLLIFHSSLPTGNAPGRLVNRDDRKLLGTDKEKNILTPQTKAYNEVGQDCVGAGCGVELFLFNNSYVDAATIGQLPRLTGGSLHKYTYFQADIDGERFLADLSRVLTRPTAYDAVMRVRTSTGVRATDFYGHFFMSNTTDVELATLDCDKAIGVEIKHDDKLTGEDGVYIQVALLYTHATGQRRLRICNLSLNVATQMADLYRCCDLDTIINFLTKQAVWRLSEHTPKSIKEGVVARCAQALVSYRKHCASPTSSGQLVLPEGMKLLPLYANCLIRSDALNGGADMSCDDRSWAMQAALSSDIACNLGSLYPRLLALAPLASGAPAEPLRCTAEKLRDDSLYLLENGVHMMLWIGLQTPPDLLQGLFGVNTAAEVNTESMQLPVLAKPFNQTIRDLIHTVRTERRRHMRLTMVRQHDKLETVFKHFLVEDQGQDGSVSYVDFLCHVHKEIRALL